MVPKRVSVGEQEAWKGELLFEAVSVRTRLLPEVPVKVWSRIFLSLPGVRERGGNTRARRL